MIVIMDWFQQINDMLPEGLKATSLSVYPLPYSGYYELWVEASDGQKYRGLCTEKALISDLKPFTIPEALKGVANGK